MGVTLVRGRRWEALLDELAERLRATHTDPFATSRVVVSSAATGRLVGQAVAARLGISAGIAYVTPAQLMGGLAERGGVSRDRARWLGSPLDLAVWDAIDDLGPRFPVLARAADPARAGGRRATATRLARLLRWYLDVSPGLLAAWLDGDELGPAGEELAERWAWQPSLFRAAVEALEVDPLDTLAAVVAAGAADPTPTVAFALDELSSPQRSALEALPNLTVLCVADSPGEAWATPLAGPPLDLGDAPHPVPAVSLHDSHGPSRQVEVLRDELTRAFAADPTLEPRHVAIVCPQPLRYASLLDAAFSRTTDGEHPGRGLRVQQVSAQQDNPVLELISTVVRLGELRASASQLVDLLLSPAVAHRWRLSDRQAVIELVEGAGVRWGMDAQHRATFSLQGLAQNTWLRGLDRLLVGLAVAEGHDGGLDVTGAEAVQSSDLETIGALCEIVSRLRRLLSSLAAPATIGEWVGRCRGIIADLVGVPRDDEWQVLHANQVLARFEADHLGSQTLLTRGEFAHLLGAAQWTPRARVAAGNGSLLVAPLGELRHVEFRLVALLGVTDDVVPGPSGLAPDAIELGALAPDRRLERLGQLLDHARSAERLLIVRQASSPRTNDKVSPPAAVDWLLAQLGVSPTPVPHPAAATAEANFGAAPSFDAAAHAGALARQGAATGDGTVWERRRRQARLRPVGVIPQQVSLAQLARFLADPAKAFLRSAANLPLFQEPELVDEMPLKLDGLTKWGIANRLLEALKNSTPLDTVIRTLTGLEELPPSEIGRAEFNQAKAAAEQVWQAGGQAYRQPVTDESLDLAFELPGLGPVRLVDQVRLRGGAAVSLSLSKGRDKLLGPWLESLALTAAGNPTPGLSFRPVKDPSDWKATIIEARQLGEADQAAARARLQTVLTAYCLGQHRLLPVPPTAAIAYAKEVADAPDGRHQDNLWRGRAGFRHRKWDSFGEAWGLFYEGEVSHLFDDPPTPEDPANGQASSFGAWAVALYGSFLEAGF